MGTFADVVAVDRFVGGEDLPLNRLERRAVVRRLTEQGRSADWISKRLRIAERSVVRLRRYLREGVHA